jgi:hypothetical protein
MRQRLRALVWVTTALGLIACVAIAVALSPVLGPARAATANRRDLLIYYADETTPQSANSGNDRALLSLLAGSRSKLAPAIARGILADAHDFPLVVQADIDALSDASEAGGFDLAVFTNALALQHRYWLHRAGSTGFASEQLPDLPPAPNAVLADSPLSREDEFTAALSAVASQYRPGAVRAVLITNAHGDETMALTPRVFAVLSFARAGEVLARLDSPSAGSGPRPRWAEYQGVSKIAFWRILHDVGERRGLTFPLVFRDSCASGIATLSEALTLPAEVGAIADTDRNLTGLTDIDYREVFAGVRGPVDLPEFLVSRLKARGVFVHTRRTAWIEPAGWLARRFWGVLLFLPLVAWIGWVSVRARPGAKRP